MRGQRADSLPPWRASRQGAFHGRPETLREREPLASRRRDTARRCSCPSSSRDHQLHAAGAGRRIAASVDHGPGRPTRRGSWRIRARRDVRALSVAIERCRERRWSAPTWRLRQTGRPGRDAAVEALPLHSGHRTAVAESELLLGFPLPSSLRAIYSQIANGGFGPGYGFVGVVGGAPGSVDDTDLATTYRRERELARSQGPFGAWPRRVLRFLEWGCNIASCVDARTGRILRYEPDSGDPRRT